MPTARQVGIYPQIANLTNAHPPAIVSVRWMQVGTDVRRRWKEMGVLQMEMGSRGNKKIK